MPENNNAELLDFLIDIFSEDNLKQVEEKLDFKRKIQSFSEQYYMKVNNILIMSFFFDKYD